MDYDIFDPSFNAPPFFAARFDSISFCLASRFSSLCLRFSSSAPDFNDPAKKLNVVYIMNDVYTILDTLINKK